MRFYLTLSLTALVVVSTGYFYLFSLLPSYFYQTVTLLLLGTAGIYFYLIDIKAARPRHFVQLYMLTLFAKLVAYGGYVFFVVWDDPAEASANALVFMIVYLLFTTIEVFFLYRAKGG